MTPEPGRTAESAAEGVVTLQEATQARPCERQGCGAELAGRQKRFCSSACRSAWWDAKHPRVGVVEQASARAPEALRVRILALMHDRRWWSMQALAIELRALPCAVSAKFRDLRKPQHGGFRFERRAIPGSKAYEFRLPPAAASEAA